MQLGTIDLVHVYHPSCKKNNLMYKKKIYHMAANKK